MYNAHAKKFNLMMDIGIDLNENHICHKSDRRLEPDPFISLTTNMIRQNMYRSSENLIFGMKVKHINQDHLLHECFGSGNRTMMILVLRHIRGS